MTLPLRPPHATSTFLTILLLYGRWSTSGPDRGNAHFFTATRIQSREWEEREQTNKRLGLTQEQKESYATLCIPDSIYRLTLAWVTRKNSTNNWNADSSWLDLLHCRWTPSHADLPLCSGVRCRLPLSVSCHQLPTSSFSNQLSSRVPFHFQSRRDFKSKTLCLVSRQNRQRNRLLGRPPT